MDNISRIAKLLGPAQTETAPVHGEDISGSSSAQSPALGTVWHSRPAVVGRYGARHVGKDDHCSPCSRSPASCDALCQQLTSPQDSRWRRWCHASRPFYVTRAKSESLGTTELVDIVVYRVFHSQNAGWRCVTSATRYAMCRCLAQALGSDVIFIARILNRGHSGFGPYHRRLFLGHVRAVIALSQS